MSNKKSVTAQKNSGKTQNSVAKNGGAPTSTLDSFFQISQRGSTVAREIRGGFVTFFAMAYILVINPIILSNALPKDGNITMGGIASATALVAGIMTIMMGLFANYPLALAAGMGLNAMVAFTLVLGSGLTYQEAMGLIFWEGALITILVLTGFREAVFKAVPGQLKVAISVGIGLFIAFVGLINAGIIRPGGTPVQLGINGSLSGWPALIFVIGLLVTIVLYVRKVRGSILIGILATWILGILCQVAGLYVPNPEAGFYSVIPSGFLSTPTSMAPTFMKMDFSQIRSEGILSFIVVVFAFLFVDIFDTIGTLIGCASKAGMLDQEGKLPGIKGALLADSVGTTIGAMFGTSTITTFVESSAGIAEGGRTGLTAIVTGALFLLSLFFSPLFLTIPSFATAPALIVVGFFMTQQVAKIEWNQLTEAIPCFICITSMAFMYSISEGISFGIISYTLLNSICGKRKNVSILMWILTVIFILKYRFI